MRGDLRLARTCGFATGSFSRCLAFRPHQSGPALAVRPLHIFEGALGATELIMSTDQPDLFSPLTLGSLNWKNRVVMAPLTRSRAGPGNVPNALNALYYAQRASAGLIISEATQISPEGQGYISTPGIHNQDQIEGWRVVTKAVRVAGGCMVLQLWHVGRISHPAFQPGGAMPVAPSAIKPNARAFTKMGFEPIPTPRALETDEILDHQIWSVPQLMDNLLVMQKALKEMRAMRGQPKLVQAAGMH